MKRLLLVAATLLSLLAACSPLGSTPARTPLPITPMFFPTDTPTPVPTPIYLNIIWSFHQPLYSTDTQTNLVTLPWVRISATRYYNSAAALLQKYPKVHAAVNISPLLHQQLDDITTGTRDIYWELSTRPANSLSDEDRQFILAHFLDDANPDSIKSSQRYQELLTKRGGSGDAIVRAAGASFTEQEIRDLQVWFNLSTFNPSLLATPQLTALVAKDRDYTEDDKQVVLEAMLATIRAIDPLYAQLQESGQVELTTSPYAEPIVPLLLDTNSASAGDSKIQLPDPPFSVAQDVAEQLKRATDMYQSRYGRPARGMLLPGGAIAQNSVQPLSSAGIQWTVTGQDVLVETLKRANSISSSSGPLNAESLNRPYALTSDDGKRLNVLFSHTDLSDHLLTYATTDAQSAAEDFINRIHEIKAQLATEKATGPHLITVVIDGDRTLPVFSDDGQGFVDALYQRLSAAADSYDIQTITPTEFINRFPGPRDLKTITAGAWGDRDRTDLGAWIGTAETNAIWSNLVRARAFLNDYLTGLKTTDKAALARAYDAMLLAEGSDWLQSRSESARPDAAYFDQAFRNLLGQVYADVGVPLPDYLQVPIQPATVITGDLATPKAITPTIDGVVTDGEWNGAGVISAPDASSSPGSGVISALYYGANGDNLFFRVDARDDWSAIAASVDSLQPMRVGIYISKPDSSAFSEFTRLGGDGEIRVALGMSATHLLEWTLDPDGTSATALYSANSGHGWAGTATLFTPGALVGKVLELATPRKALGSLTDLSKLNLVVIVTRGGQLISAYPVKGLAQMTIPPGSTVNATTGKIIAEFNDPTGDDFGPGAYTYPENAVFAPGSFDLKHVTISINDKNLVFKIDLNGPINNVWNSPIGLSIQTFDIYIDKDPGKGTGARKLLDGRNAALAKNNGWDYAIWVEGWEQQLYAADARGNVSSRNNPQITVLIDPAGTATIAAPLAAFGEGNPESWGYAIAILGQEAFPSPGVLRVRDVDPTATEWHFGGAPNDVNHTRIIDFLEPADSTANRDNSLGHYRASQETDITKLTADDYGTIPVVTIRK